MAGLGPFNTLYAAGLDAYRWESRLVVVSTPSLDHPAFKLQKAQSASDLAGWADRKLLLLVIADGELEGAGPGSAAEGARIQSRLGLIPKRFSVVVIGLDGTVKLRRDKAVSNEDLYTLIDAMPMRREELRLRNNR